MLIKFEFDTNLENIEGINYLLNNIKGLDETSINIILNMISTLAVMSPFINMDAIGEIILEVSNKLHSILEDINNEH